MPGPAGPAGPSGGSTEQTGQVNPIAFSAVSSFDQVAPAQSVTRLIASSTALPYFDNSGGAYNTSTGVFTVPVPGVYTANTSANFQVATTVTADCTIELGITLVPSFFGIPQKAQRARRIVTVSAGTTPDLPFGVTFPASFNLGVGDRLCVEVVNNTPVAMNITNGNFFFDVTAS